MPDKPQRHGDTEKIVLYNEVLTDKIIASAIEVHRHLGPGLLESAYEECFCHEMKNPVASYRVSKNKELRFLLSFPLVGNPSSERFWTSQNDYKKRKVTL